MYGDRAGDRFHGQMVIWRLIAAELKLWAYYVMGVQHSLRSPRCPAEQMHVPSMRPTQTHRQHHRSSPYIASEVLQDFNVSSVKY